LNSVIAYAEINDKQYFLDATEEFSDINVMPVKDYNWKGILIDNHNKIWRKIDLREPELAMSRYLVNATLNEDGSIEGKLQSKYSKHKAYEFRNKYKDKDLNDFISERESVFHDIEISDYKVENADVCDGMVSETFNYYQEEGADVINDKIYIQPYSVLKLDENPFKSEQRLFPVDFGYAFVEQSVFTIQIPKGYTLDSRPNPLILKIPSNLGEFNYNSNLIGDKLQLIVKFKINKPVIATENYLFLKQFFNQMIIKEAEQVVLTKI
jgi:hypothetical protein